MSLWTGTTAFRHDRSQLLVATLAGCLAMESFDIVEFATDSHGVELAERLGWKFTSVAPTLDRLNNCKTKHIWALGKLESLRASRGPVCHLDFDVYLHRQLPSRIRCARLIAQAIDWPHFYVNENMEKAIEISGLPKDQIGYNAGILGGADSSLVRDYAEASVEIAERFTGRESEICEGTTISMVVEQYGLGVFARRSGVRVETLLPLNPTKKECKSAGYTHLQGRWKREPYYVARTEERLRQQFPSALRAFEIGWKELQEDIQ